jgi:GST-like protein
MIDFYTWDTPNGQKVRIMLEECALRHTIHPVNLGQGEQFDREYLAISPNGKIPAIIDHDGPNAEPIPVFESGAILLYLADKVGRFLPAEDRGRWEATQWLMFQMGGIGPIFGQLGHFLYVTPEPQPYSLERFSNEAQRLATVVDRRLEGCRYLAGSYSIADIASYPWLARHERLGIDLDELPNLVRWLDAVGSRPAVQRGLEPVG